MTTARLTAARIAASIAETLLTVELLEDRDARLTRRRCISLVVWFFVSLIVLGLLQGWANG